MRRKSICIESIKVLSVLFSVLLLSICVNIENTFGKCLEGNCKNGRGTMIFSDGTKYIGQFKSGKWHGRGTLTFPDGNKYAVEFKDGMQRREGNWINN